jgi:hypothetical protein
LKVLINYFVDLCLLRAAPQELPASSAVFQLALVANVLVGLLLIAGARMGPLLSLMESLLEVGLMLAVLRAGLYWRRLLPRFQQTATAIMGSSALLGLVALPMLSLTNSGDGDAATFSGLLLVLLLLWSVVVLGHIVRHAFNLALGQGILVGVLYTLASYAVIGTLFPLDA